jgi:hypothetical protein
MIEQHDVGDAGHAQLAHDLKGHSQTGNLAEFLRAKRSLLGSLLQLHHR